MQGLAATHRRRVQPGSRTHSAAAVPGRVAEPLRLGDPSPGKPVPSLWTWGPWQPRVSSFIFCFLWGRASGTVSRPITLPGQWTGWVCDKGVRPLPAPPPRTPPETSSASPRQHPGFSPAPGSVCVHRLPALCPVPSLQWGSTCARWCLAAREAGMCPTELFLPSPVPTELFFGSEFPPGKQSHCQGWGWVSWSLRASWTPLPRRYLILTLTKVCNSRAERPSKRVCRRRTWGEKRGTCTSVTCKLQASRSSNPADFHLACHWGSTG